LGKDEDSKTIVLQKVDINSACPLLAILLAKQLDQEILLE
jgi:hypothetical protein